MFFFSTCMSMGGAQLVRQLQWGSLHGDSCKVSIQQRQLLGVWFFPVYFFPVSFVSGLVKKTKVLGWNSFMQKFCDTCMSTVFFLQWETKQKTEATSEHGIELCTSVTRLLVSDKAVSPRAGTVQITKSMTGIFENTTNHYSSCS